jgi:GNAT superfamily N-acetyltransferase
MIDDELDDDPRRRLAEMHAALVAEGLLEPLAEDEAETRRWLDCELASLVENRFFVALDPLAIGPEERAAWEPRATSDEPLSSPHGHRWYRVAYWLREGGERVGTIALGTLSMGRGSVDVSSLYTTPAHRRRGVAARALRRAHEVALAHDLSGLRVPTHWTWQPAVRFYLGLGMQLFNWKHCLVFGWDGRLGEPRYEVGEREASVAVERDGVVTPVIEAERDGERLVWRDVSGCAAERYYRAAGTFALVLATRGWPLIRSEEAWEQRWRSMDFGDPEGLAAKIEIWEALERQAGHEVRTPEIPGLARRSREESERAREPRVR